MGRAEGLLAHTLSCPRHLYAAPRAPAWPILTAGLCVCATRSADASLPLSAQVGV